MTPSLSLEISDCNAEIDYKWEQMTKNFNQATTGMGKHIVHLSLFDKNWLLPVCSFYESSGECVRRILKTRCAFVTYKISYGLSEKTEAVWTSLRFLPPVFWRMKNMKKDKYCGWKEVQKYSLSQSQRCMQDICLGLISQITIYCIFLLYQITYSPNEVSCLQQWPIMDIGKR